MENKNLYFVKDIYIAASLLASGKNLVNLAKEDRFYWFVFNDKAGCEQLVSRYWQQDNPLPPKRYADAIRTLKDRLFAT